MSQVKVRDIIIERFKEDLIGPVGALVNNYLKIQIITIILESFTRWERKQMR